LTELWQIDLLICGLLKNAFCPPDTSWSKCIAFCPGTSWCDCAASRKPRWQPALAMKTMNIRVSWILHNTCSRHYPSLQNV
jgi:hypothetical protein